MKAIGTVTSCKDMILIKLKSLNDHQKSFSARVTFKVRLIIESTGGMPKIDVHYCIPADVALIMDFDLNSFNEEIDKALFGKSADYITTHLTVMQIIMDTFNSRHIGICLDKDIENLMMKQIKTINELQTHFHR